MELDEPSKRKIEQLIGKTLSDSDRVNGLQELTEDTVRMAVHLASQWGRKITAILYLRYISRCTLQEAVDFLGEQRNET